MIIFSFHTLDTSKGLVSISLSAGEEVVVKSSRRNNYKYFNSNAWITGFFPQTATNTLQVRAYHHRGARRSARSSGSLVYKLIAQTVPCRFLSAMTSSRGGGGEDDGAIDLDDPRVRRQIEQKARLRARSEQQRRSREKSTSGGQGGPSSSVDDPSRWPGGAPGQHAVKKWVVLDLGKRPSKSSYDPWTLGDDFSISFSHGTGQECAVTLGELREAVPGGKWVEMPVCDWHCVTGWSCLGVPFRGVPLSVVLEVLSEKVKNTTTTTTEDTFSSSTLLRDDWRSLYQISADGYTAPVHRDDLDGAFLAVTDGEGVVLSEQHGGPRFVFPKVYGWKSAKFLTRVSLSREHQPGFWEKLGCHPRGRWELNERWAPGTSTAVWNVLAWITDQYRVFGGVRVWEFVMVRGGRMLGAIAEVAASFRGYFADFASKAEAWGERDRKWRRKRRKALNKKNA